MNIGQVTIVLVEGRTSFGLCDISERRDFIQAGITPFTCVADLEDELIRALGTPALDAALADWRV